MQEIIPFNEIQPTHGNVLHTILPLYELDIPFGTKMSQAPSISIFEECEQLNIFLFLNSRCKYSQPYLSAPQL